MGGSSKQTIGYRYFGGMMLAIGNRIEKLLDINPDERGWIMTPENKRALDAGNASTSILKGDIFGGDNQEGGMSGILDVYTGSQTEPNEYLKRQINKDISAYPNLSYLVFRGFKSGDSTGQGSLDRGFYWCSMSGMLKDMMLWVKRIHVKNDGSVQWYDNKSEIPDYEIYNEFGFKDESINFKFKKNWSNDLNGSSSEEIERIYTSGSRYFFNPNGGNFPGENYSPAVGAYIHAQNDLGQNFKMNAEFSINTGLMAGIVEMYYEIRTIGESIEITPYSIKDSEILMVETISEEVSDKSINRTLKVTYNIIGGSVGIIASTKGRRLTGILDDSEAACSVLFYGYRIKSEIFRYAKYGDINPIHKIREILTDYEAMNKDESKINDQNFMLMANRIYDESLGISWSISEKSCKEALDELLYHIEGGIRINRSSGKYEIVLFRDDLLDIENSIKFNESNIKSIDFDISNLEDSISSINVSYYDRDLIKDSSFLLYENGLERTRGYSISENVDFPYFMNRRNAEIVGNWKLKQLSTPTWRGSLKTGIEQARKINKYDVILLSWSSKNIVDLPVRVMNINLGDSINNTVTLDFIEVIPYSNISYSDTYVDEKVDDRLPPQHNLNTAFEIPYFESVQRFGQSQVDLELSTNPEIGYLMASAAKPQNNSLNAQLYTDKATGVYANMSKVGVVDYCPALYLDQPIGFIDTVFKVKDIDSVSDNGVSGFTGATSGTWIILNNEIMVYESFDAELMQITVKRGALDTVPHKHTSGAIFFSDEFSGFDSNQYVQSEIVKYQVLTSTPSALQQLELGNTGEVEFNSRAIRPYPPANIKINGEYYPDEIETDLVITWVDRNRTQQTGGDIVGWYDGNITIEQNTSTIIIVLEEDETHNVLATHNNDVTGTSSYTLPISTLDPDTRYLNISAKTSRNGFDSYQKFNHTVEISLFFSAPYDLTVEFKND